MVQLGLESSAKGFWRQPQKVAFLFSQTGSNTNKYYGAGIDQPLEPSFASSYAESLQNKKATEWRVEKQSFWVLTLFFSIKENNDDKS